MTDHEATPPTPDDPASSTGDEPARSAGGAAPSVTSTGLQPGVAALLSYAIFMWLGGLVFLLVEKDHREVRFHAAQALATGLGLLAVYLVLGVATFMPGIGWLFGLLYVPVWLGAFALWVFLMVKGYQLQHVKLPVLGDLAERWAG